jgi:TRAP-type mannitol/chloroaromatic compound transport system substrate-binding protein
MKNVHRISFLLAAVVAAACAQGAELSSEARAAFDRYVAQVESRLDQQHRLAASFIHFKSENTNELESKLRDGKLLVEKYKAGMLVPDAMIHHWSGTIFIPGATTADFLRLAGC